MSVFRGELWRHGDFLRLWSAQAVSAFGGRIAREGLPLAAVMTLDASPAQIGVLAALSMSPGAVVGLFAGGLVDRSRRKTILISAHLVRFAVLMTVPLAAWFRLLSIEHLWIVAALVGAATVFFDLADNAFLPSLLRPDQLMEGNSKLGVTESMAEIGGPALAGVLFGWLTAPFAIAINGLTYLLATGLLFGIRAKESPPRPAPEGHRPGMDLAHGWRAVMQRPLVRPLLYMTMAQYLFYSFFGALYAVWGIRHVGLTPAAMGVAIAVGGVGALVGAALAPWMTKQLGVGPAIIVFGVAQGVTALLTPLAPLHPVWGIAFMVAAQFFGDFFGLAAVIPATTLQQTLIPQEELGRSGAIFHVARGGMAVTGALAGGVLASAVGVKEALMIACAGITVAPLFVLASPLRATREISPPAS